MLILVVEDDHRVARFLTRGLQEEGFTVDRCATGDDARLQATTQPYDAILLDWGLPGVDGLELIRSWRAGGVAAPIIMLTARTGVDAAVLALEAGADDYLRKPFHFEELLARLRAALRRSQNEPPGASVRVGLATVDLRRRTVQRPGQPEHGLSGREFNLLDLLLRHRGEVLSRSRILDRAWGLDFDPTSNVVDVYVRYLRSHLDAPESTVSAIETVRGRGYRLRPEEELP